MKKRTVIFIAAALILAAVAAVSAVKIRRVTENNRLWQQAEEYVAREDYESAQEIFAAFGREDLVQHCRALALERDWNYALSVFDSGALDTAETLFAALGDYRQAQEYITKCRLIKAKTFIEEGSPSLAQEIYQSLRGSADGEAAAEELNELLYDKAGELALRFELKEACAAWSMLGAYEDAALYLERGRRMLEWTETVAGDRLIQPANLYKTTDNEHIYKTESCYLVIPDVCDGDTRFFLYFPGGRNEELYIDYFLYYLMDPAPNTIAVFMRRNGIEDMAAKCNEAAELLDRVGAECGVFPREAVVGGSSLGAYPAMHAPLYLYNNYRVGTRCVLSLDAGSDWMETALLLTEEECLAIKELGVPFYLFESQWVGMNRDGIRLMVNTGNDVTIVGCFYDDHTAITLDAMGMGVVDWALGDRSEDCNPEMYIFIKLRPDTDAA